jgi:SagB-type dehydrogenase family enzyme
MTAGRTFAPSGVVRGSGAAARRAVQAHEASRPEGYLAEANRGQQLLDGGHVGPAAEVFRAVLARLGNAPSYERAAILERLGLCFQIGGRPDLAAGHLREATGITEVLAPSDGVKALRGMLHADLGDMLRATGDLGDARKAYESALKIARELNDLRGQGVDLAHLGGLALVEGKPKEAQTHYQAALALFQRLHEPGLEAVAWHQLGRVSQAMRRWDEAERHYQQAACIREKRGNLAGAAETWNQLAVLSRAAGAAERAEQWHRKALDADRQIGNPVQLGRHLCNLAELLLHQPGRLNEARDLAEEALSIAQALEPVTPDAWKIYGILADITDKEAAATADMQRRAALEARAGRYRELLRHAPRIVTALARLGNAPSYARAAVLERLGQCFHMAGRPDLAVTHLREAIGISDKLVPSADVESLQGMLHSGLGDLLRATGEHDEARNAFAAALKIAEGLMDLRGQALNRDRLGALASTEGKLEEAQTHYRAVLQLSQGLNEPAMEAAAWHQLGRTLEGMRQGNEAERHYREAVRIGEERDPATTAAESVGRPLTFEVMLHDDLVTDHVLEPDLLLDGPREQRIVRWTGEPDPLADEVCPMLVPCVRTCMDEQGAVRFCLPLGEPILERHPDCTVMRRTRREVVVSGDLDPLWRLLRKMDGLCTVADILSGLPAGERALGARMLAVLNATNAIDVSGRPIGRFLHTATKKGVVPGGGLEKDEVLRLAMDGSYREYPGAPRLAVGRQVPDRLRGFHALTRERRSYREYLGLTVAREDFDALLHTACGVTGAMLRARREVKLRAYPSSGALYAVEVYPVVFGVEGLEPAVYHYRAVESVLEVVRPGIDRACIAGAMLPVEREMVAGAAAMICLTGFFPRHERKYGEGGYRMLVAEAGHISQNLILAATALGLGARPFGGVFDALLNYDLGLNEAEEQFLLAVLIGRPAGRSMPHVDGC